MKRITCFSVVVLLSMIGSHSIADTTHGKITFIGTTGELVNNGKYEATMRFSIVGDCGNDTASKQRWFGVRSGIMESPYTHNLANFRNMYSTLLSAHLSGKMVQIDGVSCNASTTPLAAWNLQVGIY